jgi:GAF domain-containing protein
MYTRIRKFLATPVFEDPEKTRSARLLNRLMVTLFAAVVVGTAIILPTAPDTMATLATLSPFALLLLALWPVLRRGHVRIVGVVLVTVLLVIVTLYIYYFGGIRNTLVSAYFVIIAIAGLVLGGRTAIIVGLLSMLTVMGVYYVELEWGLPVPFGPEAGVSDWMNLIFSFGTMALILDFALRTIAEGFERARQSTQALAESNIELQASRDALQTRTQELEQRSAQLRTAAEVSRDIATVGELGDLLNRAVNLVRDRFGFYHAGLFLVDEQGEYAVLQAATGEAGRQMLGHGHRLMVGEEGIVGYVSAVGLPRIALDVGEDVTHFDNPFLPETRSEMALPLRVGGQTIGALDVQSREAGAFDENDMVILQTMADQLAVAIQNARLLTEMQQTLRELEAVSEEYTQDVWRSRGLRGYRYRGFSVESVSEQPTEARRAWTEGRSVVSVQSEAREGGQESISSLAVPIKLRGQALGVLNLRFKSERVPSETISLVEEMADRLALALESARLFEETQSRARRERTIRQITEQMRRAVDVETILQTTVAQLGEVIGAPRVYVRLGAGAEDWPASGVDGSEIDREPVRGIADQKVGLLEQVGGPDDGIGGGDSAGQQILSQAEEQPTDLLELTGEVDDDLDGPDRDDLSESVDQTIGLLNPAGEPDDGIDGGDGAGLQVLSQVGEQPTDLLTRTSEMDDGLDELGQEGLYEPVERTTDLFDRIGRVSDGVDGGDGDRVEWDDLPDAGDQTISWLDQLGDREPEQDEDQAEQDVLSETGDRIAAWLDQFRSELDLPELQGEDGVDQDAPPEAADPWADAFGDGSDGAP